jgi:hypothetical protein
VRLGGSTKPRCSRRETHLQIPGVADIARHGLTCSTQATAFQFDGSQPRISETAQRKRNCSVRFFESNNNLRRRRLSSILPAAACRRMLTEPHPKTRANVQSRCYYIHCHKTCRKQPATCNRSLLQRPENVTSARKKGGNILMHSFPLLRCPKLKLVIAATVTCSYARRRKAARDCSLEYFRAHTKKHKSPQRVYDSITTAARRSELFQRFLANFRAAGDVVTAQGL